MTHPTAARPLIVGIGGATIAPSSTERALAMALAASEARGAEVVRFGDDALSALPLYNPRGARSEAEQRLVDAVRRADGLIIASPGYHGSISGTVKNALDLLEETAKDERVYLTGVPVGVIATAYGWQATGGTIAAIRSVVHALRGWPTPMAAAVNSAGCRFDEAGGCSDPAVATQLRLVGEQVVDFLRRPAAAPAEAGAA